MYWMFPSVGILAGQAGAVQLERVRACVEAAVLRAVRHGQGAGHIIDAEDFRVFRERGCGEHRECQHCEQQRKHSSFHAASSIVIN